MQRTDRAVNFSGPLAEMLKGFVDEKRAAGYKYQKAASIMQNFDLFCLKVGHDNDRLTKELVQKWTEKQPHEKESNRRIRISLMRMFGSYMVRTGHDAYVYPSRVDPITDDRFTPHIFSTKELAGLFHQADNCKPHVKSPNRHRILPLMFRILYDAGCGYQRY